MNTTFYSELRQRCKEMENQEVPVEKILAAYDNILAFQEIARTEGLLAMEKACENLDKNNAAQGIFKDLITLVVDGTESDILAEIGMNRCISSNLSGADGLVCLMYYRGCLLIQMGYNSRLVGEYIKSLLPKICVDALAKRDKNIGMTKEEIEAKEDEERVLELCADNKEISDTDYSIVNLTARALLLLTEKDIQRLLRDTDNRNLALAMKGLPGKARRRIFDNLSANVRIDLAKTMDYMGPVRVRDIEKYCVELLELIISNDCEIPPNDFSVMKVVLDMYKSEQGQREEFKNQYKELKELLDQLYRT